MQDLWLEGEGDAHPLCRLTHGLEDKTALILEHTVPTGCVSQAALVVSAPCQPSLWLENMPERAAGPPGALLGGQGASGMREVTLASSHACDPAVPLCPPTSWLPARGADLSLA